MDDLDKLKLAFAFVTARDVVAADEHTDYAEYRMMGEVFPRPLLRDGGLVDAHGRSTPALHTLYKQAVRELPTRLDVQTRRELIELLHSAAEIDDDVDARELQVIAEAERLLGL